MVTDGTLTLRPRVPEDDPRIVAIHNRQETGSAPLGLSRYRAEQGTGPHAHRGEVWVATVGEQAVGYGSFQPAWWTGDPGSYSLEIRVAPEHGRRGIGGRLYAHLAARLQEAGASRLLGWIRSDSPAGQQLAAARGFRPTGQEIQEYRLHLPEATPETYAGVEERLQREGVRIATLAELETLDDEFLRALQQVWAGWGEAPPEPEELRGTFSVWRRQVLEGPGLSPDTHWVALNGNRPVGMTFLNRLCDDTVENDYTGVIATHRGRGIASALKLRTLAWARQHGVQWFYTSSEVGNSPMLTINRRLGYRPGVHRREFSLTL